MYAVIRTGGKQYKKLQGHRQNFTEVRIKAIVADGVTYDADKK